jgi:hypothetical protein
VLGLTFFSFSPKAAFLTICSARREREACGRAADGQGDQIVRIFAHGMIVYFGQLFKNE